MSKRTTTVLFTLLYFFTLTIIFGIMVFHQLKHTDFFDHINYAKDLLKNGYITARPHLLFAQLVIIVRSLIPYNLMAMMGEGARSIIQYKSFDISALIVVTAAYLFTAAVILKRNLNRLLHENFRGAHGICILITTIILLVGPIFIFTFPDILYLGYFSPNPFHSPTLIVAKLFALILFYLLIDNFEKKPNLKTILLMVGVTVLATAAKPNFTMTLLPSVFLVIVLFYIKKLPRVNWWLVIVGFGITAVITLGLQFLITYTESSGVDKIILDPFGVMLLYSPNLLIVFVKIIFSVVFPLYITFYYRQTHSKELPFKLAWINFIMGTFTAILFAESKGFADANFFWGPIIGVFILFAVSVSIYLPDLITRIQMKISTWKDFVPAALLILHFICGIIYYVDAMSSDKLAW